ncbi:MAG: PAS domain-containing protein [Chlorobiaceae bacterium]|nr:PAS domain-containing protein [Chlorobiaceae bacterium]
MKEQVTGHLKLDGSQKPTGIRTETDLIHHDYQVLQALRLVNHLIITEQDPYQLISRVCKALAGTLEYFNVWAILVDGCGNLRHTAFSGTGDAFEKMEERLQRGDLPDCVRKVMGGQLHLIVEDPLVDCHQCPLSSCYSGRSGFSSVLAFGDVIYGVLSVSVPKSFSRIPLEQEYFSELARDLGYALHKIDEAGKLRFANDLVERSQAAAFIWKKHDAWPVDYVSGNTLELFGYPASDFRSGRVSFASLVHPEDLGGIQQQVSEAIVNLSVTTVQHDDYRVVHADGGIRWIKDMTIIRRDPRGEYVTCESILLDITGHKVVEEELRKSREQFMLAVNGSNDGIWDWNLRDSTLYLSQQWKRMLGYKDDELPNVFTSFSDNIHPDDRASVIGYVNRYLKGSLKQYRQEFRMKHKDGGYRWILARGEAVRDELGIPFRMAGSHTDITERKRSEEALRARTLEFEHIFNNSHIGIMLLRGGRVCVRGNRRLAEILGYDSPEELEGIGMKQLHLSTERFQDFGRMHYEKLRDGEQFQVEYQLRRKDGSPVWCSLSGKAFDLDDLDKGVIWVVDDLEQRKYEEQLLRETNRKLEDASRQAEMANKAKSEFLANMSHEIRTPLNGVIGMTSMLLESGLTAEQKMFAETVDSCAISLLNLIDDILDLCKIEARKLVLEHIDFDLAVLMDEVAGAVAFKAQWKGIEFAYGIAADVPLFLRGDPARLRQVLNNLAGNAVKFTERGEVVIRVEVQSRDEGKMKLFITVTDTGIGISSENQQLIFNQFTQADSSTTRKYGGTGLGLSIARQLVEMMKGEIGLNSIEGKGSTFWFTAVFELPPDQTMVEHDAIALLSGMKMLVVDDNATNREILAARLGLWKVRVVSVSDASEAMRLLDIGVQEDDPFTFAIIDMQMPEIDGCMLGRTIREDERFHALRLVMLSSMAGMQSREELLEAGFEASLAKPVRIRELKETLCRLAVQKQAEGMRSDPSISGSATGEALRKICRRNRKVLLVEDNSVNQIVASSMLSKIGLDVDIVSNGLQAINALAAVKYDIVFMDVQMPRMDGLEAVRSIRNPDSPVLDHQVPVIAMTAHAMAGDCEECLVAGMDDYIAKPIKLEELELMINRYGQQTR